MTNMDSSIFHKEENNESKIMDGGNRGSGHTVRGHDRTGQRRRAAQRLGHIHADGRRNGFRQKAHGVGALQLEHPGHRQHAAQARQHARSNRRKDRGQVLFQQLPLFIQRDRQADCGGHQKPAHGLGAGLVVGVGHAEAAQKHDHKNAAHQKGIEQRLAGLAVDPDASGIGCQRGQHAPAAALLQKLSHFYDITVEEAHEKAAAILDEHKAALEKMAEEHKTLSEENAQTQIKAETASARREINKALSAEQLTIKRDWTRKQNELKEKIFSEVKGLLESFTKTPEYENYLTAKIKEALDFAGNDEITIYLSPEDRSLAEKLQHTTGTAIQLAKDSFLGGIRATIPQKNILIDHSFAGNFEAAYKEFKFDGGPEHE